MKTIVKAQNGSQRFWEHILNTQNFQKGREKGDLRTRYNGIDYDFVRKAVGINGTDYKWYIRRADEPRFWLTDLVRGLRDEPVPDNIQKYLNRYVDNRDNVALRNVKARQRVIINEVENAKAEERARATQKNQSVSPVKVIPKISWNTRNRQYLNSLSEEERNVLENMGIDLSSAKNLQKSLNTVLGINLLEDNKIGNKTKAAVQEALLRGPQQLELTEISPISTTYQQPEISTTTEGIRPTMQTTAPINWRMVKMEELPDYASMIKNMKFQKGGQAPSALDRYKDATKFQFISNDNRVRQILAPRTSAFSLKHPAMIEQRISSDGQDTTYAEFPEHTSLVTVKPRIAKNDWTLKYNGKKEFNNSPEYNILKRRFNQASLASKGNFTPWSFNKYQILSSFNNKLK